jgi:hypothetical protein
VWRKRRYRTAASRLTVERYPRSLPEHERARIQVVSINPYEAYR